MAVLPDADRRRAWAGLMRFADRVDSAEKQPYGASIKTEIRTAIDYTDQWIDDNQASWNSGLPTSVKAWPTLMKTLLFCVVALARTGKIDWLRAFVGEVD